MNRLLRFFPLLAALGLLILLITGGIYAWRLARVSPTPLHLVDLPSDYRIRTPINSPSIQPLNGDWFAQLTEIGQGDYLVERVHAPSGERASHETLSSALSGLEDRGRLFLWSFSPDQKRFLLVAGPPETPQRSVIDLTSGTTRIFDGPTHSGDALLANVGITWAPDSRHWMEYATSDRDRIWVYDWGSPGPIASAEGEDYAFAALDLVALDERRFIAPAFRDDEALIGVAAYRIDSANGSAVREVLWEAPFEGVGPTESQIIEPILSHAFPQSPIWMVQSRSEGRRAYFLKQFPFVRLEARPVVFELWQGRDDPKNARLIWRFSDPTPRFEVSPTPDGTRLQFLDQPSFWTISTTRGTLPVE